MATAATTFDPQALKRAIEERNAAAQNELFTDDAVVEVIDQSNPPSKPLVLQGREQVGEYLADVASRDMTHEVGGLVVDGDRASYTIDCTYPDGNKVLCMATAQLRDGRIAHLRGVQAWDQ
jgi:ketosteroid isomerase-like protein